MDGLNVDYDKLFDVPKDFWQKEVQDIRTYFTEQVGNDLPADISEQLSLLEQRLQE